MLGDVDEQLLLQELLNPIAMAGVSVLESLEQRTSGSDSGI